MSALNSLAIALQGIGYTAALVAVQGIGSAVAYGTSRGRRQEFSDRQSSESASRPAQISATRSATVHAVRSNVQTSRR